MIPVWYRNVILRSNPTLSMISVAALVKFWTQETFSKCCQNIQPHFRQYFASFLSNFSATKTISWEITYTVLSNIFIYLLIMKLQFLPKCWKLWQNFRKIQSFLGRNFRKTFAEILTKLSVPQHYLWSYDNKYIQ